MEFSLSKMSNGWMMIRPCFCLISVLNTMPLFICAVRFHSLAAMVNSAGFVMFASLISTIFAAFKLSSDHMNVCYFPYAWCRVVEVNLHAGYCQLVCFWPTALPSLKGTISSWDRAVCSTMLGFNCGTYQLLVVLCLRSYLMCSCSTTVWQHVFLMLQQQLTDVHRLLFMFLSSRCYFSSRIVSASWHGQSYLLSTTVIEILVVHGFVQQYNRRVLLVLVLQIGIVCVWLAVNIFRFTM